MLMGHVSGAACFLAVARIIRSGRLFKYRAQSATFGPPDVLLVGSLGAANTAGGVEFKRPEKQIIREVGSQSEKEKSEQRQELQGGIRGM